MEKIKNISTPCPASIYASGNPSRFPKIIQGYSRPSKLIQAFLEKRIVYFLGTEETAVRGLTRPTLISACGGQFTPKAFGVRVHSRNSRIQIRNIGDLKPYRPKLTKCKAIQAYAR